jgi:hypothetical protein
METQGPPNEKVPFIFLGIVLVLTGGAFITTVIYLATDNLVLAFLVTSVALPLFWGLTKAVIDPSDNWLSQLPERLWQLISEAWGFVKHFVSRPRKS